MIQIEPARIVIHIVKLALDLQIQNVHLVIAIDFLIINNVNQNVPMASIKI